MRRVLFAALILATSLWSQTPPTAQLDPHETIQKLVTLKYADPQVVRNLLGNFGVDVRVDSRTKVIALSGHRSNVITAEEAIRELDIPAAAQRDIDLTVYFVVGSESVNVGSPIPQDLQSTVAALKTTFPFKNYVMLDVLSLRTRSGVPASTSGQLNGGRLTTFRVNSASLEADGNMVRLDNLHAGLRIPAGTDKEGRANFTDTGITTDIVDVKEGQKLVVGRSSLNGPDTALFLVLIAKVSQ